MAMKCNFVFDKEVREDSKKKMDNFLASVGYPNLYVTLDDAYDGIWKIENQRTSEVIFTCYNDGWVEYKNKKLVFHPNKNDSDTTTYEEPILNVTKDSEISHSSSPFDKYYKYTKEEFISAIKYIGLKSFIKSKYLQWNHHHNINTTDSESIKELKENISCLYDQLLDITNKIVDNQKDLIEKEYEIRSELNKYETLFNPQIEDAEVKNKVLLAVKQHELAHHPLLKTFDDLEERGTIQPDYSIVVSPNNISKIDHICCKNCMQQNIKDVDKWYISLN